MVARFALSISVLLCLAFLPGPVCAQNPPSSVSTPGGENGEIVARRGFDVVGPVRNAEGSEIGYVTRRGTKVVSPWLYPIAPFVLEMKLIFLLIPGGQDWDPRSTVYEYRTVIHGVDCGRYNRQSRAPIASPDGSRVACQKKRGRWRILLDGVGQETHDDVAPPVFSPDGRHLAYAAQDHGKWIVCLDGKETGGPPLGEVSALAFSADGERLAYAGESEGHSQLVLIGAGAPRFEPIQGSILSIAFSADGRRIVTGGDDKAARVWDTLTGHELLTLQGHTRWVGAAAFSPDGQLIVTGSNDNTAKLWNASTGVETRTLTGHKMMVVGAAFSPNGQRLVTASADGVVKVWDAATGSETLTLRENYPGIYRPITSIAFTPDGRSIVAGRADRTSSAWDSATGEELPSIAIPTPPRPHVLHVLT